MFKIAVLALLDPLCSKAETGFFALIPTAALREDLGLPSNVQGLLLALNSGFVLVVLGKYQSSSVLEDSV